MRLILICLISLAMSAWATAQPTRPNIIVIFSDDHANHAISAYGSRINQTPNLDRLAREGMRFDRSMVTNSLCGPSRATLLTGKYAHKHGFKDNQPGSIFDNTQMTFPKLLQQAGYETAVFGKWHLRSDPTGFDKWLVVDGYALYYGPKFKDATGSRKIEGYATDTIFNASIDFLKNRDGSKPFFMLVTPNAPHRNWTPDDKHKALFADADIPEPATFDDDYATRTTAAREARMSIRDDLRKADVKDEIPTDLSPERLKRWKYQRFIKDYLRCVAAMDAGIGRLLDQVDQSGLADNTLVIYTSDNGFFLGDHGWFDKRFMYEESLKVPYLARLPGVISAGGVSDAMVLNVDTAPTILDFAGVPVPPEVQGMSLRPLLTGQADAPRRDAIYYDYYEQEAEHNVAPHDGVRTPTHKLIHFHTHQQWELYDLTADPHELRNVYGDPACQAVQAELLARLKVLRAELGVVRE